MGSPSGSGMTAAAPRATGGERPGRSVLSPRRRTGVRRALGGEPRTGRRGIERGSARGRGCGLLRRRRGGARGDRRVRTGAVVGPPGPSGAGWPSLDRLSAAQARPPHRGCHLGGSVSEHLYLMSMAYGRVGATDFRYGVARSLTTEVPSGVPERCLNGPVRPGFRGAERGRRVR